MNNSQSRSKLRDEVYTQMMCAQARLSKDQNTQMGAVLVSAEGRVISTGYNGAPAGFDDETVPYTNATHARTHWKDANITYNFGHYGGHVLTCLRFIYTVQELLANEEAERKKYEN